MGRFWRDLCNGAEMNFSNPPPIDTITNLNSFNSKIIRCLEPFRPETRYAEIDYKRKTLKIRYHIRVPNDITRLKGKVEIAIGNTFHITEVTEGATSLELKNLTTYYEDGKWIIDPKKFPASEDYTISVKGIVKRNFLNSLVGIRSSENPDRDYDGSDRYSIRIIHK